VKASPAPAPPARSRKERRAIDMTGKLRTPPEPGLSAA